MLTAGYCYSSKTGWRNSAKSPAMRRPRAWRPRNASQRSVAARGTLAQTPASPPSTKERRCYRNSGLLHSDCLISFDWKVISISLFVEAAAGNGSMLSVTLQLPPSPIDKKLQGHKKRCFFFTYFSLFTAEIVGVAKGQLWAVLLFQPNNWPTRHDTNVSFTRNAHITNISRQHMYTYIPIF